MNLKLRWSTKELENYLKSDLCFLFKCGLVLNYLFYFGTQKSQWSTLSLQYTIVEKYWSHYHFVSLIIIVFLHFVILYWIRCFWKVKYTGLKSKPRWLLDIGTIMSALSNIHQPIKSLDKKFPCGLECLLLAASF